MSPAPGKVKPSRGTHLPHLGAPARPAGPHRCSFQPCSTTHPALGDNEPRRGGGSRKAPERFAGHRLVCLHPQQAHSCSFLLPPAQSCHPQGAKRVKPKFKGSPKRSRLPARSSPPQSTGQYFLELCASLGTALGGSQWTPAALSVPNPSEPAQLQQGDLWHCGIYICTSRKHLPETATNPINGLIPAPRGSAAAQSI